MRPYPVAENQLSLAGLRVLVVEDDYFIAEEVCSTLREHGAEIVGPSPDIERGLQLVKNREIDCAVLDINLQGDLAFGLAHELRRRGVPAIFATGYDVSVLPSEFSSFVRLEKPVNLRALLQAVQSAGARGRALRKS
ncbi:response regulator [Steroidobacter agaridevorans]|uniref:Response regulator n=1 Tax=Steroidobacter agaridevorans TaxID=2695856 RepID=A0A829YLY7_9GAMM|nr:response regulator [Steroidobacter agaridevorans]GFE83901.1 response regulator [Steroidobacter agaridevorans]GFE91352.1 response regulator [Steroidobacter agaridevorans]